MFHGKPKQAKTRIFTAFLRNATFGPFLASETSQNTEGGQFEAVLPLAPVFMGRVEGCFAKFISSQGSNLF